MCPSFLVKILYYTMQGLRNYMGILRICLRLSMSDPEDAHMMGVKAPTLCNTEF